MATPTTKRTDLVENLHGHQIADPYRWLEDPDSAETIAWVQAQREHYRAEVEQYPEAAWFAQTMDQIVLQPRRATPVADSGWYFQSRTDGVRNQPVLHGARTLDEVLADDAPVLLDPNLWSADQTTSLAGWTVSPDGRLLAYAVSEAGSDWHTVHFLELQTGALLPTNLVTKFGVCSWLPDSAAVVYAHFADSGQAKGTETAATQRQVIKRFEVADGSTEQVYRSTDPDQQVTPHAEVITSAQGRSVLLVEEGMGTERANELLVAALDQVDGRTTIGEFTPLFGDRAQLRQPLGLVNGSLVLLTDDQAPLGRIVSLDLDAAQPTLTTVVGQGEAMIEHAVLSRSALVLSTLEDASPVLRRTDLAGADLGVVPVTGGALVALSSEATSDEVFLGMSYVTSPVSSYRLDAASGEVTALDADARSTLEVVQQRRRATSADGTEVPYWVFARPEVDLTSGTAPTLLYGYGGFHIPVLADHRPGWLGWLQAGGVLAIANLRGGSEFGNAWYNGGRGANKQHVFDDFIACATDLIDSGVTSSDHLASYGRSNGGLLVGATMTQRPDLFAAAIPQVGVLDLLRFHKFTIGAAWVSDYGNPDVAEEFEVALAYSPLHAVTEGTSYPPTLVVTGDHDDRVVPAHSHKFTAALQHAQGGLAPILTRIESATGHSAGKPAAMVASEWADILTFAAHFTQLDPARG